MPAKPNKTQPTTDPVEAFLHSAPRPQDALTLSEIMSRVSGEPPRMWGPSIVGFGSRHYRYESGREGDTLKIGFSPRKPALVLYGLALPENQADVQALGKLTTGKGCVYIKSLADVDLARLEALIARAFTSQS